MIFTLTPNPALDLGGVVERMIPNEKNYVHSEKRFPGGNAVNVARLLTKFSVPVSATGFLGGGVGSEFKKLMDVERVAHDFVKIKGETRISVTVSIEKTHQQTRLSFPGPKIEKKEIAALMKRVFKIPHGSWLVIGGSLPPSFNPSDLNRILRMARNQGLLIGLDLPGPCLRKIDLEGIRFIKPNLIEFQELVGKKVQSVASVVRVAKALAKKVDLIFISSVEGGSLLITRDSVWFGILPKIKIRGTVGAGDSMVAGILYEIHRSSEALSAKRINQLAPQLLRTALAFAAATLCREGTQLGAPRDIKKFYSRILIRKI